MTKTISPALNTLAGVLKGQLKTRDCARLQILPQICFAEICLKSPRDKDKFPYGGITSSLLRVRGSIEPQSDLASITLNPAGLPVNHGIISNILSQIPIVFNWLRKDGTVRIVQFRIRRNPWIEALKKQLNRVSFDVKKNIHNSCSQTVNYVPGAAGTTAWKRQNDLGTLNNPKGMSPV